MMRATILLLLAAGVQSTGSGFRLSRHKRGAALASQIQDGMLRMPLKRAPRPDGQELSASAALSLLQVGSASGANPVGTAATPPPVDIYGQIRVGTPADTYTIAFDTGSGNLMLPSAECKDLGCLAHKAYSRTKSNTSKALSMTNSDASAQGQSMDYITLAISTGQAQGVLVEDKVCLGASGDVCAETAFLSLTSMSEEPWASFPYDGILGIGMPSASMDMRFNFLGNLASKGILKRNRYAVWLAKDQDGEDSEITFGDFDANRLGSEVLWLPVSKLDTGMWQGLMADVTVGNTKQSLCGTTGCQAAFDTGTSVIAGPKAVVQGLLTTLDIKEDCSNYATLPKLGFIFRMYTFNIEREDYVKKVGEKCYHQLLGIDVPAPKGPLWLLGDPFLRRYFTIYDRDSLKVGLAFSNHKKPDGTGGSNALASKDLMVLMS